MHSWSKDIRGISDFVLKISVVYQKNISWVILHEYSRSLKIKFNIYFFQDEIWKPDVALKNSYKEYKELGATSLNVRVTNNGNVEWVPFQVTIKALLL